MINVGSVINLEAFETRDRSLERERERERERASMEKFCRGIKLNCFRSGSWPRDKEKAWRLDFMMSLRTLDLF